MLKDKRFALDVLFTSVGQFMVMLIIFIQNKLLSIVLGPEKYFDYYLVNQAGNVISFFILFCLGIAIPVVISRARSDNDSNREMLYFYASSVILVAMAFVTFGIVYIFGDYIEKLIFDKKPYVILAYFFSIGICGMNYVYSYYRGQGRFVISNVLQIIVGLACVMTLFFVDNVTKVIILFSCIQIGVSAAVFISLFCKYKIRYLNLSNLRSKVIELLEYCWPRVPGEVVLFLYNLVPISLINNIYGSEVGLKYVIAIGIMSATSPLFKFVGLVLLPYAAKLVSNGNGIDLTQKVYLLLKITILISFIATAFVCIFPEKFILILYSSEYISAREVVIIFSLCIIPHSIYLILRNPLDGISKKPYNTICLIFSFCMLCALIFVLGSFENSLSIVPYCFIICNIILGGGCYYFWHLESKRISYNCEANAK